MDPIINDCEGEPCPVTCPKCGVVLGREDSNGLLVTALGIVAHLEMVHRCGQPVSWHANMRKLARLLERLEFSG